MQVEKLFLVINCTVDNPTAITSTININTEIHRILIIRNLIVRIFNEEIYQ